MPVATLLEGRRLVRAVWKLANRAPGVERATGRRADRAWDVALQHGAPPRGRWVRDRHGRHQRLSVRMKRCGVEVACGRNLNDLAEIHHRYARADVLDDREVVRNEDVGQAELLLQLLKQVDDLRLDRHVERRYRLVADDELRRHGKCARK